MNTRFAPRIAGSTLPLPCRTVDFPGRDVLRADLQRLSAGGFGYVDLVDSWVRPGDLTDGELAHLGAALNDLALSLVGLSVIRASIVDPADAAANREYTRRSVDAAAALGAPVLSIGFHRPLTSEQARHGRFWEVNGPVDDRSRRDEAIEALADVCGYAAQAGISISVELYEDTFAGSGTDAAALVRAVGAPNLGVNADLANIYRVPRPLAEGWLAALEAVLPCMNYWHVKNYRRAESYPAGPYLSWPTPLADGDIDYRTAFQRAGEAGYKGPVCIEHYGGDGLWQQVQGRRYLADLLESP